MRPIYLSMMRSLSPALPLAIALALQAAPARAKDAAADWEEIANEDGVLVWKRDVAGSSYVEFRGRARIPVHIKKVLAVLHDQDRKKEWLARCRENRLVRAKSIGKNVIYNRIYSDFPLVSDRDVVIETSLEYSQPKREVKIDVWSVADPLVPEVDGVVRMPKLRLTWTLLAVDEKTTEATYQVLADPGGMIPSWVVNYVSREIPLRTLTNLRNQVKKDGYEKNLMVVEAAVDWDSLNIPSARP